MLILKMDITYCFFIIIFTCITMYLLHTSLLHETFSVYDKYQPMRSFGENDRFFEESQQFIKDTHKDYSYGIQLEAKPGILRDILFSFSNKKTSSLFEVGTDVVSMKLTSKKQKEITNILFPKIEKQFLSQLNKSEHLRLLKTDKDYPEEPFFIELNEIMNAVTRKDTLGLMLSCNLYRDYKYYMYHLNLYNHLLY